MGRWKPDARGRLERAALDLYGERGFEQTTVAQIAERAELTERTFFRYFADKREVLFSGAPALEALLVGHAAGAREEAGPLDAVVGAFAAAGEVFADPALVRRRQAVIEASPELREREIAKLAALTTALAGALRERGVGEVTARLAAEAGVAVFEAAVATWLTGPGDRPFADHVHDALGELRSITAG